VISDLNHTCSVLNECDSRDRLSAGSKKHTDKKGQGDFNVTETLDLRLHICRIAYFILPARAPIQNGASNQLSIKPCRQYEESGGYAGG
jgi:hypothetical protein